MNSLGYKNFVPTSSYIRESYIDDFMTIIKINKQTSEKKLMERDEMVKRKREINKSSPKQANSHLNI